MNTSRFVLILTVLAVVFAAIQTWLTWRQQEIDQPSGTSSHLASEEPLAQQRDHVEQTELAQVNGKDKRNIYLNETFGSARSAVLILDSSGKIDLRLTGRVASRLGTSASVLKPQFVEDGLFDMAFEGDPSPLQKLKLGSRMDIIILVKKESKVAHTASVYEGLFLAETSLVARIYKPKNFFWSDVVTARASGAGFSAGDALGKAGQAAADQLIGLITAGLRPPARPSGHPGL